MQLTNLGPLLEKSDLSTFGRGASVYMPTSRRPVYFRSLSACVHVHRPHASLLSGSKHPRTWSPARSAHVHAMVHLPCLLSGAKHPCTLAVFYFRVHAHRPLAGLLSGVPVYMPVAKHRCTCPPAGLSNFVREARMYMTTGNPLFSFFSWLCIIKSWPVVDHET